MIYDIDGKEYKTIKIGKQEWTAENLNVERYRNGDLIQQVQEKVKWNYLEFGAWCYYENDITNGYTFGKLYNWYAINDKRGLAPEGWHIPDDSEWKLLTDYLDGDKIAGNKLKASILWENLNMETTNESGFTAFPGGIRKFDGEFNSKGEYGCYWSSTEDNHVFAWYRFIKYDNSELYRTNYFKRNGLSVRCVKNK
ncbi:MAG: fibrobacter succinogenes major paralogous domain-containing protein [Ignavibacteriae bacterium]|nr:fibrobacter succinogenes major paralogous domain-containing protein [Ignavibacteriota bacterium]